MGERQWKIAGDEEGSLAASFVLVCTGVKVWDRSRGASRRWNQGQWFDTLWLDLIDGGKTHARRREVWPTSIKCFMNTWPRSKRANRASK